MPGKILSFILSICLSFSFVVFFFHPVQVHASNFDTFLLDYTTQFDSITSDRDFLQLIYSDGDYRLVYGWQSSFLELLKLNSTSEFDVSVPLTDSIVGYYKVDSSNDVFPCSVSYPSGNGTPVFNSEHFNVRFAITATSYTVVWGDQVGYNDLSPGGYNLIDDAGFFTNFYSSAPYSAGFVNVSRSSPPVFSRGSSAIYLELSNSSLVEALPSGSISISEPWQYYNDVLLPAMRDVAPSVPDQYFVFPTGYNEPLPDPVYPSEYVTGIPKDWTIENPPLPTAPYIDFGQGDFDFSKPSEYLEEVVNEAEALDFWWWLTEKTFKKCGVFEYFLAFITLGFAMFALWRWGS